MRINPQLYDRYVSVRSTHNGFELWFTSRPIYLAMLLDVARYWGQEVTQ